MGTLRPASSPRRWWLLGCGGLLGLGAAFVVPNSTGCVYPDQCIRVTSSGHDWCRNLSNALMWPSGGSIEDAEPVLYPNGTAPQGCRCFNDSENQILDDEVPRCQYDSLLDEIEHAARQECQALVPAGYDHNCWITAGAQASITEGAFGAGAGACIGNCEYGNPPAGGSCPDLNPYECATGDGGSECEPEEGGETSDTDDSGEESTGGFLDPSSVIHCEGQSCEIDESFAWALYSDPSLLIRQSTALVYDTKRRRHIFIGVTPGSVAHALGLREGDALERINGLVIADLASALRAYTENSDATVMEVRIERGTQWVDFTYTFVR